jgi:hypothetical protein
MTWTRKEVIPVLVVGAVAALIGWFVGHAQAPHAQPTQSPQSQAANSDRPTADRFERLERDAASAKQRIDDTFNIFVMFGGIATIGLLFFGFLTWYRGEQQTENYKRERNFYEDSQREERKETRREREFFEKLQRIDGVQNIRERRQHHRTESGRDEIDLKIASKGLNSFDRMIEAQITNLTGLGKVIELVRDASQIKLDREKSQADLENLITNIRADAQQRYSRVEEAVARFENDQVAARQWPSLPEERRRVASNACRTFEQIHDFVLTEKKDSSKFAYAKVLHYLGIFSYYADLNVDAALGYLGQANELFGDGDVGTFRFNQAYTKHFLGVLKKNWNLRMEPAGTSLRDAERYLESSEQFLAIQAGQYLTAITHAEVQSYSDHGRAAARTKLGEILTDYASRKKGERGDDARSELIPRVYLLLGNLDWYDGDFANAASHYSQGIVLNPDDPYLQFSMAQVVDDPSQALKYWGDGLKKLRRPPAADRPETVTRVLIFAWGAIAAYKTSADSLRQSYLTALKNIGTGIEREGKYSPLFFSPITKALVEFDVLSSQVTECLGLDKVHN